MHRGRRRADRTDPARARRRSAAGLAAGVSRSLRATGAAGALGADGGPCAVTRRDAFAVAARGVRGAAGGNGRRGGVMVADALALVARWRRWA
jgi:hypothetical protein